jgi:hypothetical protein
LHHLNTISQSHLLNQVIALDTVKMESESGMGGIGGGGSGSNRGKSVRAKRHKRRSNAWGKWMNSKVAPHNMGSNHLADFIHAMAPKSSAVEAEDQDAAAAAGLGSSFDMEEQKSGDGGGGYDDDLDNDEMKDDFPPDPFHGLVRTLSELAFEAKKKEFAARIVKTLISAGRNISLGYGMHFGWAIEGAIGSNLKIDASYLSPHVNTAARLEAATKQFGTMFLMSEEFVQQLSPKNQSLCRKIDNVVSVL